jgi:hypothetical protein
MKIRNHCTLLLVCCSLVFIFSSCSVFAPKYGCPGSGKAVGAERLLSGEKVPKAKKFKA